MPVREFRLHPDLHPERLRNLYVHSSRLHIPGFLVAEDAQRLHACLASASDWSLVFNRGEKVIELNSAHQQSLTEEQRKAINLAVGEGARSGFQYRYHTIRVPDGRSNRQRDDSLLSHFARFLSSDPVVSMVRTITGLGDIRWADAQATRYGPGDFLTLHHDEIEGKNRRTAYVVNLTPVWRPDWGGLLMFHDDNRHVDEGFVPSFNAINLFAVPQWHSVSVVAPFADGHRYSVTGWFRAGEPPA